MLLTAFVHIPPLVSLSVIIAILTVTIGASLLFPEQGQRASHS